MENVTEKKNVLQILSKIEEQGKIFSEKLSLKDLLKLEELKGIEISVIQEALHTFQKLKSNDSLETALVGKIKKRGLSLKKSAIKKLEPAAAAPKKHTILIVDDELENLRAVTSTLEDQYNVLIAEDGLTGLELVKNHPQPEQIHMIISDQRMPRMTGIEFLEKTVTIIPKTVRIILTGFTDRDAIIDSINKGQVYKFITKPIDPKDLIVTVRRALEAYELERAKRDIEQRLVRCPETGLYNRAYLQEYMKSEVENSFQHRFDGSLIFLELDNISDITLNFGLSTLHDITMGISYVLGQMAEQSHFQFKLEGPAFAYYLPFTEGSVAYKLAEKLRHEIEKSSVFIRPVTVSAGIVSFSEFFKMQTPPDVRSEVFSLAQQRLSIAHTTGNQVNAETGHINQGAGKILIIDNDSISVEILKKQLELENFQVISCEDGVNGLALIEKERPDVILTEVMTPGVDGFLIREKTMASSDLRQKLFIFMSHLKNEDTIRRAAALRIEHYFKKPCLPLELIGLIKTRLSQVPGDNIANTNL